MPDPPAEPSTLYLVKRLELAIRAVLDERLRPHGLTTPQYTALTALAQRDGLTSAQLARRSFVTPQTMHELVRALEQAGLVRRDPDERNRRQVLVRLTGGGRDRMRACHSAVADLEGLVEDAVPDGFRDGLERALAVVEPVVRGARS